MPGVYEAAWVLLSMGIATRAVPILEQQGHGLRRRLVVSFPVLALVELGLAGWILGGPWLAARREAARPLPTGDPPNVILITMDTVRADHLSLHGYNRPTSPVLESLARSGIRFEHARSAAPWTLPSHATMFTGRWPHELKVDWSIPLDRRYMTLAGYLGERGYATAGFVGNTMECSYDNGLDRGFVHFEDYVLAFLIPLRTAWLFDRLVGSLTDVGLRLGRDLDVGPLRPMHESWVTPYTLREIRKDGSLLNGAFLDWLDRSAQPGRPFFAFLNYYDAHAPYILPNRGEYRFGIRPRGAREFIFLAESWDSLDRSRLPPVALELARDSYDSCIAYVDQCLGELVVELQRRRKLENTWLFITADHGEGLGEHNLFDHGESLYDQEIHVPLVIVPPAGKRGERVIRETVSLRDLAATIVDVTGQGGGSAMAGQSLAALWRPDGPGAAERVPGVSAVISELPAPNPYNPNHGRSPASRGPLASLADGDYVYIRNRKDGSEELYNDRADPGEVQDLSRDPSSRPILDGLRRRLEAIN